MIIIVQKITFRGHGQRNAGPTIPSPRPLSSAFGRAKRADAGGLASPKRAGKGSPEMPRAGVEGSAFTENAKANHRDPG